MDRDSWIDTQGSDDPARWVTRKGRPPRHEPTVLRDSDGRVVRVLVCDFDSHVYWNARHGGWRWRVLPSCANCCRNVSRMLAAFRKRLRRGAAGRGPERKGYRPAWPDFQYLHVREEHKSGAMHLHVAVTGIPASVTRSSRAGLALKRQWAEEVAERDHT